MSGPAAAFIESACPDQHVRGRPAHDTALFKATRMLEKEPALAAASFEAAIVCGNLDRVRRELDARPSLATQKGGPKSWEPLLYLAFTRLNVPSSRDNAVAMARLLLDHGANPNVSFKAGDSDYTPLVGVIGEGEEDRPAHPRRDELVHVLLEAGAEPYDMQVVYNIHFHGRALWWLRLMHEYSLRLGRAADWKDPEWQMLAMGPYGSGARWHYWIAIEHGDSDLARWCVEHGASPNAPPARDARFSKRTLFEDALLFARPEIAELLARHGARRTKLTGEDAFVAACRAGEFVVASENAPRSISFHTFAGAARENRVAVLDFLLSLGANIDASGDAGVTALHEAAYHGARDAAAFLIAKGANVDATETRYGATPLGWAVHAGRRETIDLLSRHSRDVFSLVYIGAVERVREVLRDDPALATQRQAWENETLLMWLPNDDDAAAEMARLLIASGTDPRATNFTGVSAAEIAERRQLDQAAKLIAGAANGRKP